MILRDIDRVELKIPLKEIAHEVPVDRAHVRTLAESIKQSGQLSPLLIWTQRNQVIDGFHRVEALKLVGADIALCDLIDCSAEEFRDARITSAVMHKGVSFTRIVMWGREAFNTTPWASRIGGAEAFHLDRSIQHPQGYRRALRLGLSQDELQELLGWVKQKSSVWGLKPEQIANILDLANITAPSLIPLVGPRHQAREEVLTRPMLRSIVSQIPDHEAQEALAHKAIAEKLNEAEVRRLVVAYANTQSPEKRQSLLSTSWLELEKPTPTSKIVIATEEDRKRIEEDRKKANERFRIDMVVSTLTDIARNLPDLPIDNHPHLRPIVDKTINQLLISISRYQQKDVNLIAGLEAQIGQLTAENQDLRKENELLNRNLTALRSAMGMARRISDEESRLRQDR